MAGDPVESLGGKTTLEAAHKPAIDMVAAKGRLGMLHTVPDKYEPGSEIANLAVLGYDLDEVFEGRGSLEAASMGIEIEDGEMAMRCNIITIADEKIKNHSAGHISTEEATILMEYLQEKLGDERVGFYPGISYRHLLKVKGADKRVHCTPPHDVPGTPFKDVMVKANCAEAEETAALLNDLIIKSQELLKDHPVNLKRIAEGKDPANSIWMWSPGYRPAMKTLMERYGLESGAVISAVDLIRGIGVYAGMRVIEVEGITGLHDTNYEGKAQAAIEALKTDDIVYLHIEASDEAGHEGKADLKVKTIEYLSERAVKPIMEAIAKMDEPVRVAILPDHPTPIRLKTHTRDAVPFVIYDTREESGDEVMQYDEASGKKGSFGTLTGEDFIKLLLQK